MGLDVPDEVDGREVLGRDVRMVLDSEGVDAVEREGGGGSRGMGTLDTDIDLGGCIHTIM